MCYNIQSLYYLQNDIEEAKAARLMKNKEDIDVQSTYHEHDIMGTVISVESLNTTCLRYFSLDSLFTDTSPYIPYPQYHPLHYTTLLLILRVTCPMS